MTKFEKVFIPDNYAVFTLLNGNISECIRYLRELKETGIVGQKTVHEDLMMINEMVPEKYQYVKNMVFHL